MRVIPNPGSTEARELDCICPVLDNNHGRFAPWPDDGWWISGGCQIHDPITIDENCTGAYDCPAPVHTHGCFADDPCPHEATP